MVNQYLLRTAFCDHWSRCPFLAHFILLEFTEICLFIRMISMLSPEPLQVMYELRQAEKQLDQSKDADYNDKATVFNIPDFEISQVIAKNSQINIKCLEDKPYDHFFLRMNDLGYDGLNITNQTIILDEPHSYTNQSIGVGNIVTAPSRMGSCSQVISKYPGRILKRSLKKQFGKQLDEVVLILAQLQFTRIQMMDYLEEIKESSLVELKRFNETWIEKVKATQVAFTEARESDRKRILKLQNQLDEQSRKMEEIEISKEKEALDELHWKEKTHQLQEEMSKCNAQINQLQIDNEELKYQLMRLQECQKKMESYESQIATLQHELDQNSEYMFDLQQKLANSNFELSQRENAMRKEYEASLKQEQEKIERNFVVEFERVQEEMKSKIIEQVDMEYQSSAENLARKYHQDINDLKKEMEAQSQALHEQIRRYQDQIRGFQSERMKLVGQNRDYQARLYQMEQHQMRGQTKSQENDRNTIQDLSYKLMEIQDKYRDKESQLSYYKQARGQTEQSILTRSRSRGNILILQESILDHSLIQSAISPSSANQYDHSRQNKISSILNRIKLRQQGSTSSQIHEKSFESGERKMNPSPYIRQSVGSIILQKEKDIRMRNISSKLQQLRADIRRQIGTIAF